MGRFYKSTKGNYLDFIYQQPKALMLQAIQTADKQIAQQEAKAADLYGRLKFNALTPDTTRRDEIIDDYKSQIDTLAEDIRANPLDYRRDSPKIRALSDNIKDNMERGEIAAIESNYAARQAYKEKLGEQVKSKDITADELSQLMGNYDQDFSTRKGTMYQDPQHYQAYKTGFLAPNIDLFKTVDERAAGFKAFAEQNFNWGVREKPDGTGYIVTTNNGTEYVTKERIQQAMQDFLLQDDDIREAFTTRQREGITGYSAQENQQKLASALDFAVQKYHYTKETETGNAKGDPFKLASWGHALKQKATPLSRKQEKTTYSTLPAGAKTYEDGNDWVNGISQNFDRYTVNGMQSAEKDLLSKRGLVRNADGIITKTDGSRVDMSIVDSFNKELDMVTDAYEKAKTTGDFSDVKGLKSLGINVDEASIDNFSNNYYNDEVVAEIQDFNTKKEFIKEEFDKRWQGLHSGPVYDGMLELEYAKIMNDKEFNTSESFIRETQALSPEFQEDKIAQAELISYYEKVRDNPEDMLLGPESRIIQSDGTTENTEFNDLVKAGAIKFDDKARKEVREVINEDAPIFDEEGNITGYEKEKKEVVIGHIGGKEVYLEAGEVFHSFSNVEGMADGGKVTQRFKIYEPGSKKVGAKPMTITMATEQHHIPLPPTLEGKVNTSTNYLINRATSLVERALNSNKAYAENYPNANLSKLQARISGVPGLYASYRNGRPTMIYKGGIISNKDAEYLIIQSQSQQRKNN